EDAIQNAGVVGYLQSVGTQPRSHIQMRSDLVGQLTEARQLTARVGLRRCINQDRRRRVDPQNGRDDLSQSLVRYVLPARLILVVHVTATHDPTQLSLVRG